MTRRGGGHLRTEQGQRPKPMVKMVRVEIGLGHVVWAPMVLLPGSRAPFASWEEAMDWANWLAIGAPDNCPNLMGGPK